MLLDTSGLLCFFDDSDTRHTQAVAAIQSAITLLTHDYVLAEFIPLCQTRGLPRERALRFVRDLLANPMVEIRWTGEADYHQALALLEARRDKTYSLCDAYSFVLMRERGLIEALTTDKHFEQEGFIKLLPS
ncbi:MAG: type II toxin-antitoxin system VapC family toxin [Acidobacteria bacterium]|nr:type II toxin-antitoxin system VapC family toxin [Acidobacteriota bacterium]MBI3422142.1 type II toxin-antitoxin system VapC family toxin [Acidobacteriota bacterium]